MNVRAIEIPAWLRLDHSARTSLHRQLYEVLRGGVLEGRMSARARLPSTRALAAGLGVSRSTVVLAFDQLLTEGYVEGRTGSGTYVAASLPEHFLGVRKQPTEDLRVPKAGRGISRRGALLAATPTTASRDRGATHAFRPGVPAFDEFPASVWKGIAGRFWREPSQMVLGYGDPAGYWPLRCEISSRLNAARGVRCDPEQVILVSGSQQALDLASRILLDPGDAAWVEDPGYIGTRGALTAAGARIVPVPVDGEGLNVEAGIESEPEARLACVTPSHQYPMGVTMSFSRRLELLAWAERSGGWIVEDDYDSEYRYAGRPLEALQGLDSTGRVIYVGTFSKVLFPALRLGYLVVPSGLVDTFTAARELTDRQPPGVDQAILTEFIADGHFARHIRRTRALYAHRQSVLVEEASKSLADILELQPSVAGMHLVGWLPEGTDDREASRLIAKKGVEAPPVSLYALETDHHPGIMFGYAAVNEPAIRAGIRRIAETLK